MQLVLFGFNGEAGRGVKTAASRIKCFMQLVCSIITMTVRRRKSSNQLQSTVLSFFVFNVKVQLDPSGHSTFCNRSGDRLAGALAAAHLRVYKPPRLYSKSHRLPEHLWSCCKQAAACLFQRQKRASTVQMGWGLGGGGGCTLERLKVDGAERERERAVCC